MRQLKRAGMNLLKILHLCGACAWLGGALCMLLLNMAGAAADREGMLYGVNYASHVIDLWVVVAAGVYVCLATGLLYGILTPWGFAKHRWVAAKWLLTIICFCSGWMLLGRWENAMLETSSALGNGALQNAAYLRAKASHFWFSLAQIAMLIAMLAISVIKPWKKK